MTKDELTADFEARVQRATKPPSPPISTALSVLTFLFITLHAMVLVRVAPAFQQLYDDIGLYGSDPTHILLSLSNHYLTSICTLVILAAIIFLLKRRMLLILFDTVLGLLFFIEAIALFVPLLDVGFHPGSSH